MDRRYRLTYPRDRLRVVSWILFLMISVGSCVAIWSRIAGLSLAWTGDTVGITVNSYGVVAKWSDRVNWPPDVKPGYVSWFGVRGFHVETGDWQRLGFLPFMAKGPGWKCMTYPSWIPFSILGAATFYVWYIRIARMRAIRLSPNQKGD